MKKTLLIAGVVASFCFGSAFAQKIAKKTPLHPLQKTTQTHNEVPVRCATPVPGTEWDTWFNGLVEKFQQEMGSSKLSSMPSYTIPVIVHVIHNGEAVGTGSNISNAQVNSQITVLNNDFAGTGLNNALCPSAFTSIKANTGISFCMATKNPSGVTLATPGIDRVNRNTAGFSAPPYSSTTYIDGTIKPATIWNPTLYCNIWVLNLGGGLLGYATFPTGTGLSGITGSGTMTTDGVVIGYSYFGDVGTVSAPYDEGRTTTHEIGHWLGLRHINGDSNCGSDFVTDTPTQDALHGGCISSSTPYHVNTCGAGTSPNGEMTMNFMDYTDDDCMYMFTNGQSARFQTCMANGTHRVGLQASSVNLCNSTPVAPTAAFTFSGGTHCTATPHTFTNTSSGTPTSYLWAVSPSAGVTITTATSASPTITFTNPGTYSVTLTATNAQGSDNDVQTFVVSSCAGGSCDTISNFNFATHTVSLYGSGGFGYASGHNDYLDKAKADFFAASSYPAGYLINQAFYFFAKNTDGSGGAST
ncbi:MAG: PKD domain-containing protein, partial [Bacteroidia bacterium]|nr:PKD domain-containing protein [Bacteroidia bacterium]